MRILEKKRNNWKWEHRDTVCAIAFNLYGKCNRSNAHLNIFVYRLDTNIATNSVNWIGSYVLVATRSLQWMENDERGYGISAALLTKQLTPYSAIKVQHS